MIVTTVEIELPDNFVPTIDRFKPKY